MAVDEVSTPYYTSGLHAPIDRGSGSTLVYCSVSAIRTIVSVLLTHAAYRMISARRRAGGDAYLHFPCTLGLRGRFTLSSLSRSPPIADMKFYLGSREGTWSCRVEGKKLKYHPQQNHEANALAGLDGFNASADSLRLSLSVSGGLDAESKHQMLQHPFLPTLWLDDCEGTPLLLPVPRRTTSL